MASAARLTSGANFGQIRCEQIAHRRVEQIGKIHAQQGLARIPRDSDRRRIHREQLPFQIVCAHQVPTVFDQIAVAVLDRV